MRATCAAAFCSSRCSELAFVDDTGEARQSALIAQSCLLIDHWRALSGDNAATRDPQLPAQPVFDMHM